MTAHNWLELAQDADTGIETLRAHFEGLRSPQAMQRFNRCMAVLLLVSAWLSVLT